MQNLESQILDRLFTEYSVFGVLFILLSCLVGCVCTCEHASALNKRANSV